MKHKSLLLAIVFSLFTIATVTEVPAQDIGISEKLTRKLKTVTSESTSGVAIMAFRDGKLILKAAGGMADIENKIPATVDTKFRIGSISKQFTAMSVIRLAERGKLSLQDPLSKYFPNLPNAKEITLENLLTHTSGLPCYTSKPGFYQRVTVAAKPEQVISFFEKDMPDFKPGTNFKYCNSGYFLLGEIVAKVSGQSFAAYLDTEFFKPLGMNNTGIFDNSKPPQKMAFGYSLLEDKYQPALNWDMSWAGGCGAMYSTVGDLILWNEALYSGKVISKESLKNATTPFKSSLGANTGDYGYGLMIGKHRRIPIISHSGGLQGWTAELAYYPEQKCSVAVLTNAMPANPDLNPKLIARSIANRVLEDIFKSVPPPQVDPSIKPNVYPEYIGKYDYVQAVMEITVDNNRIFATITGQEPVELLPMGKDEFFWKDVEAEITFMRNDQGEITAALHSQFGDSFLASRISENVAFSEKQMDAFVGRYQYGPGTIMTCTREGKQLFAQLTGQAKLPIFPVNETTFAWKLVEAKVEFIKDNKGRITTARHSQNGTTFDAPRIMN